MTYILAKDGRDEDVARAFRLYEEYLRSVRDVFPPSAYALATSDWYYNFYDHRCPHDSWLESFQFVELSSGERHEIRSVTLKVRLLGAYHDGYIELVYPQVFAYELKFADAEHGHRDLRYDELRTSDRGRLIHEIEFWNSAGDSNWLIEASDLQLKWVPFTDRN